MNWQVMPTSCTVFNIIVISWTFLKDVFIFIVWGQGVERARVCAHAWEHHVHAVSTDTKGGTGIDVTILNHHVGCCELNSGPTRVGGTLNHWALVIFFSSEIGL